MTLNLDNQKQNSRILRLNKKIFYIISTFFLLTFFIYLYFVAQIVYNIIERKNTENSIRFSKSQIALLELTYFNLNQNINLELVKAEGLEEPIQIGFATRSKTAKKDLKSNEI